MNPSERLAQIWTPERKIPPVPESATITWSTDEPHDGGLYLVRYIEPGSTFQRLVTASREGYKWKYYVGGNTNGFIPPGSTIIATASLAPLFLAP
ncbi:hypothetical protein B2_12 [Stenotrophomonas phage B2]|nr:hypothetical protein B2_12 [Stenotrophomonas phage B2]